MEKIQNILIFYLKIFFNEFHLFNVHTYAGDKIYLESYFPATIKSDFLKKMYNGANINFNFVPTFLYFSMFCKEHVFLDI